VGLLEHASNVPQTAMFMQDLFSRAGFPAGTFQTPLVSSGRIEAILRDDRVTAATLTGSGPAGQSVAAIAGSEIKKVVLELGGSAPRSSSARMSRNSSTTPRPRTHGCCAAARRKPAPAGTTRRPCWPASEDMRVHSEEVFGPVATRYRVADIDAAIALANGTEFGLGANARSDDEQERARFTRDLAAGLVFINGNVTSYPQLPFGGIKTSGHGRELAVHGIREFCNIKSVWAGGRQGS
jgi:acyl-CoA reductase-like NAD-dependent aldehyde dehydrogenase